MVIRLLALFFGLAPALLATWLGSLIGIAPSLTFLVCLALIYLFKEILIDIAEDIANSILARTIGGKNIRGK